MFGKNGKMWRKIDCMYEEITKTGIKWRVWVTVRVFYLIFCHRWMGENTIVALCVSLRVIRLIAHHNFSKISDKMKISHGKRSRSLQ